MSSEALNIPQFDEKIFNAKIQKIIIPCKGEVDFIFKDGTQIKKRGITHQGANLGPKK